MKFLLFFFLFFGAVSFLEAKEEIHVGTFNVRNYLIMDRRIEGRYRPDYPKPEDEKSIVRQIIIEANADILALQEMGPRPFLNELQQDLALSGLDYQHAYLLEAADEVRHLAILSKIPFKIIKSDDLTFKYMGGREAVKRGVLEVVLREDGKNPWSLYVVHLKSRYTDRKDDPESEIRRVGEARAVRNYILRQNENPQVDRFLIVGDFNDTRASRTLKAFLKRGNTEISTAIDCFNPTGQVWTYFYEKEAVYSRVDYILASTGMRPFVQEPGEIFDRIGAQKGSDHRLVMVTLKGLD